MGKPEKKTKDKNQTTGSPATDHPDIKTDSATDHAEPVSGPVLSEIESNIDCLVDDYIKTLPDPEMLTEHNGVFVGLLKYIYINYLQYILKNNTESFYNTSPRYDYNLLNDLFNIYTSLVYQYKKNKQCYINEFCLFTHVSRELLYNIKIESRVKATGRDSENVKRWFAECEQSLLNGSGVAEIFKLKSMFRYNDNLAPLPIEYQAAGLTVSDLPKLGQKDSQKLLNNHGKGTQKGT